MVGIGNCCRLHVPFVDALLIAYICAAKLIPLKKLCRRIFVCYVTVVTVSDVVIDICVWSAVSKQGLLYCVLVEVPFY